MYTEKTQQESSSRTIQIKPGGGRVYMKDNRTQAVGQAKMIDTIQRQPVGTGRGTDNDRRNIDLFDAPAGDIPMEVTTTDHKITIAELQVSDQVSDQVSYTGQLKHYMVVKNGTRYQFPVKHLQIPRQVGDQRWKPSGGHKDVFRGGQPEGFGGNQDWAFGDHTDSGQMSLFGSRSATLAHEYSEEARRGGDMGFNIERSKLFHTQWGDPDNLHHIVGTLSIASTGQPIGLKPVHHPGDEVEERGMAEMAGTIVIDCGDLVDEERDQEELEVEIGNRIEIQRNALFPGKRLGNPFACQGGILAHLVGLVAEDIIAQRQLKESSSSSSSPSSSPSSTLSSGIEEIIEDSESYSEGRGKVEIGSEEESAEEMDVVEKVPELSSLEHGIEEEDVEKDSKKASQTDDASKEDVDEEEETDAVEEDGVEEESQTDDVSEERPEHSQSRGWFSTILGAPWRWIKRLFSLMR